MRSFAVLLFIAPVLAIADVPHNFQSGTTARASEVNENFTYLDNRIDSSLTSVDLIYEAQSDGAFVAALCPTDYVPISANCECSNENGERNQGVLNTCQIFSDGGIAGCFNHLHNPELDSPLAKINLACVKATSASGLPTALKPEQFGHRSYTKGELQDVSSAVKAMQDQMADYHARLQEIYGD